MTEHRAPVDTMSFLEVVTDRRIERWYEPREEVTGLTLNLGAGNKMISGATPLDLPDWDADLSEIPTRDETARKIYAIHFLEHVRDPIRVLRECQRVLKPGGVLNVGLPYYTSQGAYHDLDHKSFWCEETWRNLFANHFYDKNHGGWKFRIGLNLIAGIVERNTMLITQLIREP